MREEKKGNKENKNLEAHQNSDYDTTSTIEKILTRQI